MVDSRSPIFYVPAHLTCDIVFIVGLKSIFTRVNFVSCLTLACIERFDLNLY